MEEEQREWRNRMFALAGVGDPDDEADEGVDVDGMTYEELTELGEHIGTQSKGVSKEAMATLTRFAYGDDRGTNNAEKQKETTTTTTNYLRGVSFGFRIRRPLFGSASVRPRVPRGVPRAVARGEQKLPAVQDGD
jgi:hypothetical protein